MSFEIDPRVDMIFNPKSVAVVGAMRAPGTVPHDLFQNMLDGKFQGCVYPINPREKSISGVRTYKYVADIQDPVDLAIIVFPSSVVHMALEHCGKKGIKSVIIISAGFKEVGEAGIKRQQKLQDIADEYGIRIIGPNCLGAINTDPSIMLNASFARKMPAAGPIGFVSQSGALCTAVLDYAQGKHIGFSKFVSFGNKMDINEVDLLYYLGKDEATKVILLYLEEITDGKALVQAALDVQRECKKPILAIKSGRTAEGASAAASHTGSLAGSDEVANDIFRQAGIMRCRTLEEMFNKATAMAYQPIPHSDKLAIITNAGGPGVMAADACIDEGLKLASFSEETTAAFKKSLPATANIKNPVDVIGDARSDRYEVAIASAQADPNVGGTMVILTPQSMTDIVEIAEEVVRTARKHPDKPIYASFMGEEDVAEGIDILQKAHIPHYILPEDMAVAAAAAYQFDQSLDIVRNPVERFDDVDTDTAKKILADAAASGTKHLPAVDAQKVLAAYGLPVLEQGVATSGDEAGELAAKMGCPVAMKIYSAQVVHKVDVGGVVLNVEGADAAKAAYESIVSSVKAAMPDAVISGVSVEPMAAKGVEVILGLKKDNVFGHAIMFGLGGSFVEIFKDVVFRTTPLDDYAVSSMVRGIKSFPILDGARGRTKADVAKIEECIKRLGQLATDCPEIEELDINPFIVLDAGKGAVVADARIMI